MQFVSRFPFKSYLLSLVSIMLLIVSCSKPIPWPESPLYDMNKPLADRSIIKNVDEAKEAIVGHYAHYDIVAYEDTTTQTPMRNFTISYGFTDFYLEDGKLMQIDKFVHAEQKINQKNVYPKFRDEATQAIKPRVQEVEVYWENGQWNIYRAPTPSLLGIDGDPSKPLSADSADPNLTDPDKDGKPGVTVEINIGGFIKGELYITRREIYTNYLVLNKDGSLTGYVKDDSEQFVVGASMKILRQPSNAIQYLDKGLNPVVLIPIDPEIDTPKELMEIRDDIFPPEPEFRSQ